jgi:hypothetical protein
MVKINIYSYVPNSSNNGLTLYHAMALTKYVVRCDKIHDVLELADCEFQYNNFSFDVYDPGWIYQEFQAYKKDDVFAEVLYGNECIFFGRLKTNTPSIDCKVGSLKFDCEHILADMANISVVARNFEYEKWNLAASGAHGRRFIWEEEKILEISRLDPFAGGVMQYLLAPNQAFYYGDIGTIYTGIFGAKTLKDLYIAKLSIENGIDHLTLFGNFLRSLALMFYWRDNVFHIKKRSYFIDNTSDIITLKASQVIDLDRMTGWELSANKVVINTVDTDGNNIEVVGQQVRRPYYRRGQDTGYSPARVIVERKRGKIIKKIDAPYVGSFVEGRYTSQRCKSYDSLINVVFSSYENYYCRTAQQVSLTLEGIDWWVGQKIYVPVLNRKYLIQETYKDLEDMSTEVVAVTIDETNLEWNPFN